MFTTTLSQDAQDALAVLGKSGLLKNAYLAATTDLFAIVLAHSHDIAAMKLVAICDRGTKKDYVDLFELVHKGITMEMMLDFYEKKYQKREQNTYSIIKALNYFDEAEATDMPKMLIPISWDEVKHFFVSESMRLAKKYLE